MVYVLSDWFLLITHFVSYLNLAELPFFIYNASRKSLYNYFLSEYATWNVEL